MSILDLAEADYARKMAEQHCSFKRHNAQVDKLLTGEYTPPNCEDALENGMNIISNSVLGDDAIKKILEQKEQSEPDIQYPQDTNTPERSTASASTGTGNNGFLRRNLLWMLPLLSGIAGGGLGIGATQLFSEPAVVEVTETKEEPGPQYIWEFVE